MGVLVLAEEEENDTLLHWWIFALPESLLGQALNIPAFRATRRFKRWRIHSKTGDASFCLPISAETVYKWCRM